MDVAKVTFLKTTARGQDVLVTIALTDRGIAVEGPSYMADRLFQGINRGDREAVLAVMRDAPRKFDGAYLRASYEESAGV